MSRSHLKNRYMKSLMKSEGMRNPYHFDEMPKNLPSKYISVHCKKNVRWIQEPGSFEGHKVRRGGHRRISGIVRQNVRKEVREMIESELSEI